MKLSNFQIIFLLVLPFICCSKIKNKIASSDNVTSTSAQTPLVQGQRDLDLKNTNLIISACPANVTFNSSAQAANNLELPTPTPGVTSVQCSITLSQLAYYSDASRTTQYIYKPQSGAGLTGTFSIDATTGNISINPPTVLTNPLLPESPTNPKIPATAVYVGSGLAQGLTASVTFGTTGTSPPQILITWNVNSFTASLATLQNFQTTGSNAVPPTVTGVSLLADPVSSLFAANLNFISSAATPVASNSQTDHNATTIYQALDIKDASSPANPGARCYLYLSSTNFPSLATPPKPTWYDITVNSSLLINSAWTSLSKLVNSAGGFVVPQNYADIDALYTATRGLTSSYTDISNNIAYYLPGTPNKPLGIFSCAQLLNYSIGNWGGTDSSDIVDLTASATANWAQYNWFAIFANAQDSSSKKTTANAYTLLNISSPMLRSTGANNSRGQTTVYVANNLSLFSTFSIQAYTQVALLMGGSQNPTTSLLGSNTTLNRPYGLAFDKTDETGNLWVANSGANTLLKFLNTNLSSLGNIAPAVTISSSQLNKPYGIVFDKLGNLWVANNGASSILQFASTNLAGGTPSPNITISGSKTTLSAPSGITFDSSGGLWIANSTPNSILKYTSTSLGKGSSITTAPDYILSGAGTTLNAPAGLTFDTPSVTTPPTPPSLWIANSGGGNILKFAGTSSGAGIVTTPSLTITIKPASNPLYTLKALKPTALQFDSTGNLWVSDWENDNIYIFSASQLSNISGLVTLTPIKTIFLPYYTSPSGILFRTVP